MRLRRRRSTPGPASQATPPSSAALSTACQAPFSSLYLDPRGEVRVCCLNQYQRLGRIGRSTLREIWLGPKADALRDRLAAHDLSLGCELCQLQVDAGSPETAYLHVFDDLHPETGRPAWPKQLELALSNACNLQCVMCNGDLSSAIRLHREGREPLPTVYDEAFFEELDHFLPHLERVIFLGGEPFLGKEPLRVMERLVELDLHPRCHVTTNGTQWSPRIERILRALPMHVAVSVDAATDATAQRIRVGSELPLVQANVAHLRDAARATGADCSISFTLQRANVQEFGAVLAWADRLDVDVFVNQLTYPPQFSIQHLGPEELAGVLARLEVEDPGRRAGLGRNLGVWEATLGTLRGQHEDRVATPVAIRGDLQARARALAAEGADDRGVVVAVSDPNQIIRHVDPDPADVFGLDLRPYLGSSLADLVSPLVEGLGDTVSTRLRQHDDGIEERTMVFDDGVRRTTLNAVLANGRDGTQHWYFSVQPATKPAPPDAGE